jgi:hypothetical protein
MRGGIRVEANYFDGELAVVEEDIESMLNPSE